MVFARLGVVGAGAMGSGIAQVLAMAGAEVYLSDVDEARAAAGRKAVETGLARLVSKGKLDQAKAEAALGLVHSGADLGGHRDRELVIEAASERLELKLSLFASLGSIVKEDCILASNTSSISITRLASAVPFPGRVLGLHFFNPAPVMALVEVVRGLDTSDGTAQAAEALARDLGKTPVSIRNSPGFAVNRILCPMINEAIYALSDGVATAAELDEAMRLGANHPMGPLALCDLIGLDVELAIMQVLQAGFGDPKYRPAPLLVEMVEAGRLGRKTKRGFFEYP